MLSVGLLMVLTGVAAGEGEAERPVVLVELFTSEGCSSCPSADRLLAELEADSESSPIDIVPLSFHVDYWNYLGWRDPFSSPEFTARQKRYAARLGQRSVYTPQLVVDGAEGFVGSDRGSAREAIAAVGRRTRLRVSVGATRSEDETARVEVSIDPAGLEGEKTGEVLLAITESGLTSKVTRGENTGRELPHTSVVRKLSSLGEVSFVGHAPVQRTHTLRLERDWNPDRLHVAVWVQGSERVLGAARVRLR